MTDTHFNPTQSDGFEFFEFAAKDPKQLRSLFKMLGFAHIANHETKKVEHWKQNRVNFFINAEPGCFAEGFSDTHGPCASGMGFKVKNAKKALEHCLNEKAKPYKKTSEDWHYGNSMEVIYGIGDNLLFLVDESSHDGITYAGFKAFSDAQERMKDNAGLVYMDHATNNVFKGHMDDWADFYQKLFNFREIRFFDIKGQKTGLQSRAMMGPCNKLCIPINEPGESKEGQIDQIQEYLNEYKGEGIQHIAMGTRDIYETVEKLKANGMGFLDTPDTYYRLLEERLPGHGEPIERMQENRILIDGTTDPEVKILLQIFTKTSIGPIFFEIIQRKGDNGFGEGNFTALFESIELDQMERGILQA